jgi:hypothetical protein
MSLSYRTQPIEEQSRQPLTSSSVLRSPGARTRNTGTAARSPLGRSPPAVQHSSRALVRNRKPGHQPTAVQPRGALARKPVARLRSPAARNSRTRGSRNWKLKDREVETAFSARRTNGWGLRWAWLRVCQGPPGPPLGPPLFLDANKN